LPFTTKAALAQNIPLIGSEPWRMLLRLKAGAGADVGGSAKPGWDSVDR